MTTQATRIPYLPARIEGLSELAMNLWWSWSREARRLFRSIDPALWHLTRHNPLELLCRLEPDGASPPAQPARGARPDRARGPSRVGQRQRLPPPLRRGPDPDAPRDLERRHLVPEGAPRARRPSGRLLLCRVRAPQLGADLLGRPGRAGGRPVQGGERPRRPHGGRRAVLYEGVLRPASQARRLAGGQRRGVRR